MRHQLELRWQQRAARPKGELPLQNQLRVGIAQTPPPAGHDYFVAKQLIGKALRSKDVPRKW